LVKEIFHIDSRDPMPAESISVINGKGGQSMFLPLAEKDALEKAVDTLMP
jgi:hypothetical protein